MRTSFAPAVSKLEILEAIAEGTNDAIFAKDREGRYIFANRHTGRIFDRRPAEILGKTDVELLPSGLAARISRDDQAVLDTGAPITFEETMFLAGGPARSFRTTKAPLHDAEGRIAGVFGIARDVTDEKRLEQERDRALVQETATRREADERADRLRRFELVTERMLAILPVEALLRELLSRVRRIFETDTVTILMLDRERNVLRVRAALGIEEEMRTEITVPVGTGISGRIAATGEPLVVEDVPSFGAASPVLRARGVQSMMGVPLRLDERVVGVLHVATLARRRFVDEDVRLLQVAADRIAVTLESARLFAAEREARERAEAAEDRYRALVDGLDRSIVWEADAGTLRVSFVSLAAERVLGFPVSAWRAEASFFLGRVHPDDHERVLGVLRAAAADRRGARVDHRMLTADCRTVWVHTGVAVGKRPDGGPVLHGITVDITDLHLAAEEVQNRARQQAATAALGQIALAGASVIALFQQAAAAVARELRVELAAVMELSQDDRSLRLAAAHGFPEDAVGRDVLVAESGTLWAENGSPPAEAGTPATCALLSRRPVVTEDFATDRRFEPLPLVREAGAASGATVAIAGDSRCYGVLAAYARTRRASTTDDVHFLESVANILAAAVERDRLLADLRDARERAERSARGREELVTILSHDLRNALGAVLLAAQLAARSAELPDKEAAVKRQLARITRQVGSINRLLSSILDVGRIERGRLSMERVPRDAAAIAQEAHELVAPQAEDRALCLTVQIPQDLPPILADRERMVQVLANLLGNAVKFTKQGGVTLSARAEGGEVIFSVADTGPGIPDDQLPRLFDRYWQAPSGSRQGVGLGLFVAKSIVEAHGGRIWVESARDNGSTFHFTVPIADERIGDPPTKS